MKRLLTTFFLFAASLAAQTPPGAYNSPNLGGNGNGNGLPSGGLTGQTIINTAPGTGGWSSAALPPASTSPVSTASYAVRCDSGAALLDRSTEIHFTSGASAPTLPLSSGTGCSGLFARLVDDTAGALTVSRTSTDTFTVYTVGSAPSTGQTSFALANGQYANVYQNTAYNGTDKWEVYLSAASAGGGAAIATVFQPAQTAAVTTFTLCAAATCGNGSIHQYRVDFDLWESGTACSTVSPAAVGTQLTWTDESGTTHSAIAMGFQSGGSWNPTWNPSGTTLATVNPGSGSFVFSTNGTIIQAATTYANCGAGGPLTYNIRYSVFQLQ